MHPVKNSQTRSDSELDCRTLESDFFPFPQSSLFVVQEHFWLVKINDAYLFQPYVREGWGGWGGGSGSWGGKGAQALEGWLIESKLEVTQKRLNFQCRSLLEKTLAITFIMLWTHLISDEITFEITFDFIFFVIAHQHCFRIALS